MQIGFYPGQWYYNKTQHTNTLHTKQHTTLKQNTGHKTAQTTKDTLHTMNTRKYNYIYNKYNYNYNYIN
jgi:hypothetical protein